jgi:hypothetical protein
VPVSEKLFGPVGLKSQDFLRPKPDLLPVKALLLPSQLAARLRFPAALDVTLKVSEVLSHDQVLNLELEDVARSCAGLLHLLRPQEGAGDVYVDFSVCVVWCVCPLFPGCCDWKPC